MKRHCISGKIAFDILEDDGKFIGVSTITFNAIPLCCDEIPFRVVVTAENGIVYDSARLIDAQVNDDKEICIETEIYGRVPAFPVQADVLWHPMPPSQDMLSMVFCDRLVWRIRPESKKIGSRNYHGLSMSFTFTSETRKLHDIWLYSNWQIGANLNGLYVVTQQWGGSTSPWEWLANQKDFYSTGEYACDEKNKQKFLDMLVRGGGTSLLDFQFRIGQGILARWFEGTGGMITSKVEKSARSEFLFFYDRICCVGKSKHTTEKMMLMLCEDLSLTQLDGRNAWIQAFSTINTESAAAYGIHLEEPEPMLFVMTGGPTGAPWSDGIWPKQAPDFYEKWIKRLDDVVRMGFKRILLHTPGWVSDVTENRPGDLFAHHGHVVAAEFGGNEALARFCTAAHKRGLQVIVWIGTHNSAWSPVFKEHPDWAIRDSNGQPCLSAATAIHVIPGDMSSGFKEKVLSDLRVIRECGADGIWYDSFHNIGIRYVVDHPDGTRSLQSTATLDFLRQIQEMGYILELETIGAYGCPSCGIAWDRSEMHQQHVSDIKSIEYTAYRTGLSLRGVEDYDKFDRDTFFRMMAHQAVLGIHITDAIHFEQEWPIALPSDIIALQHLYLRLTSYRGPIELIENGVIWYSKDKPGTRVLWALEDIPFPEGRYETVQDITDDKSVMISPDSKARQGRVYLMKNNG